VEACDESWSPRSNATALAGFALTTTSSSVVATAAAEVFAKVSSECCTVTYCFSNGSACPTATLEPELKLTAREPGAVREVEMTVAVGESVNIQKSSAEDDTPSVSPSVSESVHQSGATTLQQATTVTAAALLSQSVPSASPLTSAETKGIYVSLSAVAFCLDF